MLPSQIFSAANFAACAAGCCWSYSLAGSG
jgi:hypothetical protein